MNPIPDYLRRAALALALLVSILAGTVAAQEPSSSPASTGPFAALLQSLAEHHVFTGAVVLVADKEKVLDVEAAGYSSVKRKTPMRPEDLFWIASMTKSFTATALMMMVDEGKLMLDDAVEKHLPEFKGQMVGEDKEHLHPPRHPITVREIMSHTSGLVLPNDAAVKRTESLKDNVAQYAAAPLLREPGTKFQYNNTGIETGGRLLEVLSGLPYAEFMQKRLLEPLGLKETTFWPTDEQAQRLASSARFTADKSALEEIDFHQPLSPALLDRLSHGVHVPVPLLTNFGGGCIPAYVGHHADPAGGLYSTAGDVGKFGQMLLNGGNWAGRRYLSAEALKQMTTSQTGEVSVNPQESYGAGWFVKLKDEEGPSIGSFGHRGARRTVMWVDPTNQLVLIVLVQRMDMSGEQQKELYTSLFQAAVKKYGHLH